ncbi:hypothetical protein [Microbacterium sp.]|uniref:hypothetical protein n=1 Tax=Microbacterium sp. TaxID=51671 RepID=UPI0033427EEC
MSNWTEADPGAGDRSAATSAAQKIGGLSSSVTTLGGAIDSAAAGVGPEVWGPGSGDAFRTSLQRPKAAVGTISTEMAEAKKALETYASAVDAIRASQQQAEGGYDTAYREWRIWAQRQDEENPGLLVQPASPPAVISLALTWGVPHGGHHTYDTMRACVAKLRTLAADRKKADDAVIAALAPPAGWDDMKKALTAIHIEKLDDLSSTAIAKGYAELASKMTKGDLSASDAEALKRFFQLWGNDRSVMAQFSLNLGGEKTVDLIDHLGDEVVTRNFDPGLALALATMIRGGLSLGSSRWSPATASQFADEMLTGASSTVGGKVSAIGFLFSDADGAPLGQTLTVEMANRIDRIEREFGRGAWIDTSPMGGGRTLAFLEGEKTGLDGNRVDDLAGRVFSTLGHYPDAALDWLMDGSPDDVGHYRDGEKHASLSDARIKYWFGERPWGAEETGDGFEGPAALWSGAQQVAGGPTDPTMYDPSKWERVSSMTTHVVQALLGNEDFLPEHLSEMGQVRLAEGITHALPYLAENVSETDPRHRDDPFLRDALIGSDELRPIPNLSQSDLAKLLGTATWSDGDGPSAGATYLATAIREYQNTLLGIASTTPPGSAYTSDALERVVELQGWIDGSPMGSALGAASRHDAAVQEAIDGVAGVIDMLPIKIPNASHLIAEGGVQLIDKLQDIAIGEVKDQIKGGAVSLWGNTHEALAQQYAHDANGREIATMDAIEKMMDQLGIRAALGSDAAADSYLKELAADYARAVEANSSWAEKG